MRTMPFLLVDRPSRSRIAVSVAAPATAAISTGRNASESGSIAHEMIATAGMRNTATCAPDARAISAASLMLPRRAMTTAPPCSAALPTIATMTAATKNSLSPDSLREHLERADEDLGHEGRDERCGAEHEQRGAERPSRERCLVRRVQLVVPAQRRAM